MEVTPNTVANGDPARSVLGRERNELLVKSVGVGADKRTPLLECSSVRYEVTLEKREHGLEAMMPGEDHM